MDLTNNPKETVPKNDFRTIDSLFCDACKNINFFQTKNIFYSLLGGSYNATGKE